MDGFLGRRQGRAQAHLPENEVPGSAPSGRLPSSSNYSGKAPRKGGLPARGPAALRSGGPVQAPRREDSYLVDSASSHMLVSKIKPCMSKYKQLYGETANGSLNQLSFI